MKISLFTETIYKKGGGSQFAAINLSIGLKELGHDSIIHTIYTPYSQKHLKEKGIKFNFLKPLPSNFFSIDFLSPLNFIKKNKPDLIILNECFSTYWIGLLCAKLFHIPTLAYFHTYYFKNRETNFYIVNKIIERLTILYLRLCYKSVNYLTCPSVSAKEFLIDKVGISSSKVDVCPYPIFENIKINTKKQTENKSIIKFLYTGRIVKGKNVDLLIKTFANLNIDNWNLTIIGDGNYKKIVSKLICKYGLDKKIKIYPFMPREDLLKEYKNYDYFISLSDMETFGFTYLEALIEGIDVICLKYSTSEELFSEIKNVFFLESKDSINLAEQLSKIIKDAHKKNHHQISKEFFDKFTYTNAATKLVNRVINI